MDATRMLPETAVCLHCGYSLRGLPENVCPECGRGFDPVDPMTWRDLKRKPTFRAWIEEFAPPSNWEVGGTAIASIVFFAALSNPRWIWAGRHHALGHIVFWCMLGFAGPSLGKIVGHTILRVTAGVESSERRLPRAARRRWSILLVCLAGGLLPVVRPGLPFQVRFAVSRPFLEHHADRVRATGKAENYSQFGGLFRFHYLSLTSDNQVKFEIDSATRFVHDPEGARRLRTEQRWYGIYDAHLGGDWYLAGP